MVKKLTTLSHDSKDTKQLHSKIEPHLGDSTRKWRCVYKCVQFRHILAYAVEDEFSSHLPFSEWFELLSSSVEVVDEFFAVPMER